LRKSRKLKLAAAIGNPSIAGDSPIVTNMRQKLATGGGAREPVNPAACCLITVMFDRIRIEEPDPEPEHGIRKAPRPFLLVKFTSHTITYPVKGIMTWELQGRADEKSAWEVIDSMTSSTAFAEPNRQTTFPVDERNYFRYFKLEQIEESALTHKKFPYRHTEIVRS
jgi:hypothetical protein